MEADVTKVMQIRSGIIWCGKKEADGCWKAGEGSGWNILKYEWLKLCLHDRSEVSALQHTKSEYQMHFFHTKHSE